MKKTALAIVIAAMSAALGPAHGKSSVDMGELSEELNIMQGIVKTAFRNQKVQSGLRVRQIEATYLANQGIVFDISTSGSGSFEFNFDFSQMLSDIQASASAYAYATSSSSSAPAPPPAPQVNISGSGDWTTIFVEEGDWERYAEDIRNEVREAMHEARDKLRELRDLERGYEWEQREYEREKRDLEFQKRTAQQEVKSEIERRLSEIREKVNALSAKRVEVSEYAEKVKEEQKKRVLEQNEVEKKKYVMFLANFESNVADILCKYGAGIKALPSEENVSFVLKDLGRKPGDGDEKVDKVYVFANEDIQRCVRGKIDEQALLTKVQTYHF